MVSNILNIKSSIDNKIPISYMQRRRHHKFPSSMIFSTASPTTQNDVNIASPMSERVLSSDDSMMNQT